ncbi:MAG: bifunctional glutamate N-acetyltransferase/amino-acid acetyltransferase ArgJ [Bacteroidota bacterium]
MPLLSTAVNANACTGERGLNDAWTMVKCAATALGVDDKEVLISSTGVIGQYLPIDLISTGIPNAVAHLSAEGHAEAAAAIMTTDTFMKELAVSLEINGHIVTIGGMAKGSGMIAPNMATLLCFITTDANIGQPLLQLALTRGTEHSFNRISVDGDTSTNDMVILLANGLAGNTEIHDPTDPVFLQWYEAFEHLLVRLSKMIVMDGEGATKFVEIIVEGAATEQEAVQAAKSIANSNLVKTAINGEDANWGRILAAIGYSGIDFDPAAVEIFLGDVPILGQQYAITISEEEAKRVLKEREITITVHLHRGSAMAAFWTCDLSQSYVAINANYRT